LLLTERGGLATLFVVPVLLLAQAGQDARSLYSQGAACFERHDFAAAKGSFQQAIKLDQTYGDAYKGLGLADIELKDYDGAYHAWVKAASLNPKDAKTRYYLGRLFYEADFPNEAAAWLRECLKLAPNDYAAMTYLGLSAEALGFDDTALQLYRNAIAESRAQNKPYSWAFLSLGKLLMKRGDDRQALAIFEEGERSCPEAHELAVLGELLEKQNQTERAEQVLRRALALDPSLSQAHYRLALLLRASGRTEEASLEMQKFKDTKLEEQNIPKITALRK